MMSSDGEIQLLHSAEAAFRAGNMDYAKKILLEITRTNKSNIRANELLAYVMGNDGDLNGAIELLQKVVESSESRFQAPYELGSLYLQKMQLHEAIDCFKKSLMHGGNFFELFHDFAIALGGVGQPKEAVLMMEKAIHLNPHSPEAFYNLGRLYDELKDYEKSLAAYQKAISYNGNFLQAHINQGIALYELDRSQEALVSYKKALSLNPRSLDALLNQGMAFHALNLYQDALNSYDAALLVDSNFADAIWNKSLVQLTLANFKDGWKNYEARFDAVRSNQKRFNDIPLLPSLQQLKDREVLVWCEQGYGDVLQFCRYIPLMVARGAEVTFLVPSVLQGLIKSLGYCRAITDQAQIGAVDYQIPLLSLPRIFYTGAINIPNSVPYLQPPHSLTDPINNLVHKRSHKKLRIGVACSGSPTHTNDLRRSMPLNHFSPLLELGDIYLIQKGLSDADKNFLNDHPEIVYCGDEIRDFQDSAALVSQMDIIVTVDTSLAHLAGSLNQRTMVCLPYSAEWRWQSNRIDSPWYPSAQLFRQSSPGNWSSVIENIYQALKWHANH